MSPLPPDMTPSQVGERAEAAVMAALAAAGKHLLVPFGQKRYDLAYEEGGRLIKVQVKSGREVEGAIFFRTHSAVRQRLLDYRGDADMFGVYCHDRGSVYLVPVEDVPRSAGMLRLEPPRNGQRERVRWASRYLVKPVGAEPPEAEEPSVGQSPILTNIDAAEKVASMSPTITAPSQILGCCPPLTQSSLSLDEAHSAATLFKALADPHRVLIVNRLLASEDAVCVCDLNENLELSQPTVSFHLKKLLNAGIVVREQRGTWAYYSVAPAAIEQLSHLFKTKGRTS